MNISKDTMGWWQNASVSTNCPYNGTSTNIYVNPNDVIPKMIKSYRIELHDLDTNRYAIHFANIELPEEQSECVDNETLSKYVNDIVLSLLKSIEK